ncbi:MAG: hypothetical protein HFH80_10900 [Lachnospiraceae bacterium]|nr:hypothetical protein [Lachnospiraceae bacterium]
MRQTLDSVKKGIVQYGRIIIRSIICAGLIAFNFSWLPALYRIRSLEIGEYPEEPVEIISARLQEMRPVIIGQAVLSFFLLLILFLIIFLLYWFKREHNINLIQKIRATIKKKN